MKKLTIINQIKEINEDDIISFGEKLGLKLPADYVKFISKYGGARIEQNSFEDKYYIQNILPLSSKRNASIDKIIETYREEYNTTKWLPFAVDAGGWVFVVSLNEENYEQVFVDRFDIGEENPFTYVAPSLEDFVNNLKPQTS